MKSNFFEVLFDNLDWLSTTSGFKSVMSFLGSGILSMFKIMGVCVLVFLVGGHLFYVLSLVYVFTMKFSWSVFFLVVGGIGCYFCISSFLLSEMDKVGQIGVGFSLEVVKVMEKVSPHFCIWGSAILFFLFGFPVVILFIMPVIYFSNKVFGVTLWVVFCYVFDIFTFYPKHKALFFIFFITSSLLQVGLILFFMWDEKDGGFHSVKEKVDIVETWFLGKGEGFVIIWGSIFIITTEVGFYWMSLTICMVLWKFFIMHLVGFISFITMFLGYIFFYINGVTHSVVETWYNGASGFAKGFLKMEKEEMEMLKKLDEEAESDFPEMVKLNKFGISNSRLDSMLLNLSASFTFHSFYFFLVIIPFLTGVYLFMNWLIPLDDYLFKVLMPTNVLLNPVNFLLGGFENIFTTLIESGEKILSCIIFVWKWLMSFLYCLGFKGLYFYVGLFLILIMFFSIVLALLFLYFSLSFIFGVLFSLCLILKLFKWAYITSVIGFTTFNLMIAYFVMSGMYFFISYLLKEIISILKEGCFGDSPTSKYASFWEGYLSKLEGESGSKSIMISESSEMVLYHSPSCLNISEEVSQNMFVGLSESFEEEKDYSPVLFLKEESKKEEEKVGGLVLLSKSDVLLLDVYFGLMSEISEYLVKNFGEDFGFYSYVVLLEDKGSRLDVTIGFLFLVKVVLCYIPFYDEPKQFSVNLIPKALNLLYKLELSYIMKGEDYSLLQEIQWPLSAEGADGLMGLFLNWFIPGGFGESGLMLGESNSFQILVSEWMSNKALSTVWGGSGSKLWDIFFNESDIQESGLIVLHPESLPGESGELSTLSSGGLFMCFCKFYVYDILTFNSLFSSFHVFFYSDASVDNEVLDGGLLYIDHVNKVGFYGMCHIGLNGSVFHGGLIPTRSTMFTDQSYGMQGDFIEGGSPLSLEGEAIKVSDSNWSSNNMEHSWSDLDSGMVVGVVGTLHFSCETPGSMFLTSGVQDFEYEESSYLEMEIGFRYYFYSHVCVQLCMFSGETSESLGSSFGVMYSIGASSVIPNLICCCFGSDTKVAWCDNCCSLVNKIEFVNSSGKFEVIKSPYVCYGLPGPKLEEVMEKSLFNFNKYEVKKVKSMSFSSDIINLPSDLSSYLFLSGVGGVDNPMDEFDAIVSHWLKGEGSYFDGSKSDFGEVCYLYLKFSNSVLGGSVFIMDPEGDWEEGEDFMSGSYFKDSFHFTGGSYFKDSFHFTGGSLGLGGEETEEEAAVEDICLPSIFYTLSSFMEAESLSENISRNLSDPLNVESESLVSMKIQMCVSSKDPGIKDLVSSSREIVNSFGGINSFKGIMENIPPLLSGVEVMSSYSHHHYHLESNIFCGGEDMKESGKESGVKVKNAVKSENPDGFNDLALSSSLGGSGWSSHSFTSWDPEFLSRRLGDCHGMISDHENRLLASSFMEASLDSNRYTQFSSEVSVTEVLEVASKFYLSPIYEPFLENTPGVVGETPLESWKEFLEELKAYLKNSKEMSKMVMEFGKNHLKSSFFGVFKSSMVIRINSRPFMEYLSKESAVFSGDEEKFFSLKNMLKMGEEKFISRSISSLNVIGKKMASDAFNLKFDNKVKFIEFEEKEGEGMPDCFFKRSFPLLFNKFIWLESQKMFNLDFSKELDLGSVGGSVEGESEGTL